MITSFFPFLILEDGWMIDQNTIHVKLEIGQAMETQTYLIRIYNDEEFVGGLGVGFVHDFGHCLYHGEER